MTDLPHGFTLEDLARMSRYVAAEGRSAVIERAEAADIAAVAIVARLYEPGPAPSRAQLFDTARAAVHRERDAIIRERGGDIRRTGQPASGYWRYWIALPGDSLEDRVTDKLAVWQVWAALRERDAEVLWALAVTGTYQAAADALGCSLGAYYTRLQVARRRARELWAAPFPPAPPWGSDRRRTRPRSTSIIRRRAA